MIGRPTRSRLLGLGLALALWAPGPPGPAPARAQDDAPLTIADLDSYRSALRPDDPDAPAPEPVAFADLWGRPGDFLGRRVAIEGRAARRFRQPAVGEYPPLVELWLADRAGNPSCVVYPEPEGGDPTPLGATVRFPGTYQKRLEYRAGDEPRLAPLIVGPGPPAVLRGPSGGPARGPWRPVGPFRGVDWLVGAIVAAAVASAILRQALSRPNPRRSRRERADVEGPPPRFVDGPADADPYNGPGPPDGPPGDPS
ncbi:hypothetical protein [Tautonia plasticadhaerens]|uniref:Uncharacterized protein n=1 Tax=Tautonia plasticadhaerens TaxID=2527974 RepID=A0A518H2R3_9BACT|nr:hypothetical protein [Tautonia plasticadhaerens]QDV35139.1 hypothetical protein ElP_30420 [Tautonia plasticadhaerens]